MFDAERFRIFCDAGLESVFSPQELNRGIVILKQFYLNCLAHASYLIGDKQTGNAVVVDPQRDIERYLEFAAAHKLRIQHVILTHLHADFIAGHLELRDRVGATIYLGAKAKAEYRFTPLADGTTIEFGRVRLKALETPGHTPESISILVYDLDRSATDPQAVLTGDTLFIGDVGRPDLRAALGWSAADLGALLYDSLHSKLLPLPDSSLVYPAHGAGSLCGKAISKETVSTIGEQRRLNYALQPMGKQAFIDIVTADQPEVGNVERAAAGAGLLAAEAAIKNGKTSIQIHGGMGFTWEVPAHLYLMRARVIIEAIGPLDDLAALLGIPLR